MRPIRLAIFDCDGTLVDSGNNIFAALAEAFTQHGVEVPALQEVRQIIGLSLVEAIAKLWQRVEQALAKK